MIPLRKCYTLTKRLFLLKILAYCVFFLIFFLRRKNDVEVGPAVSTVSTVNTVSDAPTSLPTVDDRVHVFYYPWYGNPENDGVYLHWNHEYITNWDTNDRRVYPTGKHHPPEDIGANFYPLLGCYSSRNASTVKQHFTWVSEAGLGVLVISWYPPDQADAEGRPFDQLFPLYLDEAGRLGLKVAFHVEPYEGRNPKNFARHLRYISDRYGHHPALYRLARSAGEPPLPVYYIYDSYRTAVDEWKELLEPGGVSTVRGTSLDGVFLGLVVEPRHKQDIAAAGFDGFYTYFAANEFTYGSSWKHWKSLSGFARKNGLLFAPSVGPGYEDTGVRPWNGKTTRRRDAGRYYGDAWRAALRSRPHLVSVTSFNEWHEGTQIEPAVPFQRPGLRYNDYAPKEPDFYLKLTRKFVTAFNSSLL